MDDFQPGSAASVYYRAADIGGFKTEFSIYSYVMLAVMIGLPWLLESMVVRLMEKKDASIHCMILSLIGFVTWKWLVLVFTAV